MIGNLDADISFDEDHFEFLLNKFARRSRTGSRRNNFQGRRLQLGNGQFRRAEPCFRSVPDVSPAMFRGDRRIYSKQGRWNRLDGGDHGADDGLENTIVSREIVFSLPALGTAERGVLASSFSYGEKDYYLGGHPVWEMFRVAYRLYQAALISSMDLALGLGYGWAFLRRSPSPVSNELMTFHRKEQMQKLSSDSEVPGHIQSESISSKSFPNRRCFSTVASPKRERSSDCESRQQLSCVSSSGSTITARLRTIIRATLRAIWRGAPRLCITGSRCWERWRFLR